MSLIPPATAGKRRKLFYGSVALCLVVLVSLGVMASNGWLPSTDPLTGKKTGWFGKELARNASSSWNPLAAPLPNPTPTLKTEYVYAGSRLLAVEDANANAAPPGDIAVWRPSTGQWSILGGPGSQQTFATWGTSGDVPVPGDFDGDRKTDFSIFRPSTGTWWVYYSSNGNNYSAQFGATCSSTPPTGCDITAPADYDGDGKTDLAVFRPSTGTWYIYQSSNQATVIAQFGNSTDIPSPADYDGDGKADIAVWRGSNTTFYAYRSSDSQLQTATFGNGSSDVPVSGDYDGDGKADFALKSGNSWIILSSSTNTSSTTTWQNSTDIPVQNDYDGDGKVDIAVWRGVESSPGAGDLGNWYIRNSHDLSTRTQQWGATGDKPVPAYYRR